MTHSIIKKFINYVDECGPIFDRTAIEDMSKYYYELDADIVDALIFILKEMEDENISLTTK